MDPNSLMVLGGEFRSELGLGVILMRGLLAFGLAGALIWLGYWALYLKWRY